MKIKRKKEPALRMHVSFLRLAFSLVLRPAWLFVNPSPFLLFLSPHNLNSAELFAEVLLLDEF